jgi:methylated-DNA-[protein]-cysteine S-methyltransferase
MEQYKMSSPVGPLYLVASEEGLHGVFWKKQSVPMIAKPQGVLLQTVEQLEEYFAGQRKNFSLPLAPRGTDFQCEVWKQLVKIPYARTKSYAEIAQNLGRPKAFRAVGSANGKNPLSIVVPCHRVIASDGSLAGFAGGVNKKSKLLDLEQKYK